MEKEKMEKASKAAYLFSHFLDAYFQSRNESFAALAERAERLYFKYNG